MRIIKKKISLEQFKSRLPLTLDAFNVDGERVNFNTESGIDDNLILNEYPMGDYGMFPLDIDFSGNLHGANSKYFKRVYLPKGSEKPKDDSEYCNVQVVDENTGQQEYKVRYDEDNSRCVISIINDENGEEEIVYSGATSDYCSSDGNGNNICGIKIIDGEDGRVEESMSRNCLNVYCSSGYYLPYGTLKEMYYFFLKYNKLLQEANCGSIEIKTAVGYWEVYDKDPNTKEYYEELDRQYIDYGGDDMSDYIINTIFRTFEIPSDLQNYWKCDKLYYTQALWWYNWFEPRHEKYADKETIVDCYSLYEEPECSCKEEDDKVDNTKECLDCEEFFNRGGHDMYERLTDFVNNFPTIKSADTSSIDLNVLIPVTIDKSGEYTIFSEEWVGGRDYSTKGELNTIYGECLDTVSDKGTTVVYNDEVWVKINDGGKGFIYNPSCNKFEFDESGWEVYKTDNYETVVPNDSYSYNEEDVLVWFTSNSETENSRKMALSYHINTNDNGYVVINGELYPIYYNDCVEYNETWLNVQISNNKKYITFRGKKYFAYQNSNDEEVYNIDKVPCIKPGTELTSQKKYFILYKNQIIVSSDGELFEIEKRTVPKVDGYFTRYSTDYFIKDNEIVEPISCTPNDVFGESLNGETISSKSKGYLIENGNILIFTPYIIHSYNKVSGETSSKIDSFRDKMISYDEMGNKLHGIFDISDKEYAQPNEDEIFELPYHIGNVDRLSVTYKSDDTEVYWGDILTDIEFWLEDSNGHECGGTRVNALGYDSNNEAIADMYTKLDQSNDIVSSLTRIKCSFTYYMGALIDYNKWTDKYTLNSEFTGIKYVDECTLEKKPENYYITNEDSYNIYYYNLIHKTKQIRYNNIDVSVPIAEFEYKLLPNNGKMVDSPLLKKELNLGITSNKKIEEDIYIERPIMKPHEQNMFLLDVMTLDSLTRYKNGGLRILSN